MAVMVETPVKSKGQVLIEEWLTEAAHRSATWESREISDRLLALWGELYGTPEVLN